jgi:hypothetical protein
MEYCMHSVQSYRQKYASAPKGEMKANRCKINSTLKWVEYSFDIHDMNKLLISTKNLSEKYSLMDMLDIAERKKLWHYRQENFNLNKASELLQALIKIHG